MIQMKTVSIELHYKLFISEHTSFVADNTTNTHRVSTNTHWRFFQS